MYQLPDPPENNGGIRRRILIVDDEPTLLFGFAYALSDENTIADTASDGAEALEHIEKFAYDAIILDLRMPDIDGLAVIGRMRENGNQTPVILCSAFITLHSALLAIRHHVVDFLMKPVKPRELRKAVAAVLGDDGSHLGSALRAMRSTHIDDAIGILESCGPDIEGSEKAWLRVMTSLRDNGYDLPPTELELEEDLVNSLLVHLES